MADTPRPDVELLAELGPLAAVIADKLHTVPVRLGPGGTDDLITALTLAIALHVGRDVLPAGTLGAPPYEPSVTRLIETQRRGVWARSSRDYDDPTEARTDFAQLVTERAGQHACRLVRATTTYAVEAEHNPEQP